MKMPPPIATKFTKLVLTILAITILGIILSFISQDHTLLMLSAGVAVAGGVKIIDYYRTIKGEHYECMQNNLDRFDFTEDKIFGEPDEHGLSTVTKLSVKRASVGTDGKPRNYPWCVIVENGRAVKEKTATGGTHIKSGTYKKQRSVYVNINDLDFFNLVYRTTRFIESWELTYGPKLIRDARKLLSEQRAAAQQ